MIAEPASKWSIWPLMMSPSRSAYSANTCSRSASRSDCWMTCFAVWAPMRPSAEAASSIGRTSPSCTSGLIRSALESWIWLLGSSTFSTTVFRRNTLKAPVWISTLTSMFSSAPYARLSARAMMSPTTSLGRPFSAESCARPVTSSRFMLPPPFLFGPEQPTKKVGHDPPRACCPGVRPAPGSRAQLYQRGIRSARGRRYWPPRLPLREVVPDIREQVLQLIAKEHHRDDDRDGDNGNDECVFDQPLALVLRKKAHSAPSGSAAANRHASGTRPRYGSGTSVPSVHDRRSGARRSGPIWRPGEEPQPGVPRSAPLPAARCRGQRRPPRRR